jgi:cytochrome P450
MDQPAFHHKQIAGFANTMTEITAGRLKEWPQNDSAEIDIASELARLTYSIVGKTLFNFDTGKDAATVEQAMRLILPHIFYRLGSIILPPTWWPSPGNRRFRASLAEVDEVVYRIIQEHRAREAAGMSDYDLLGMLLRARDPDSGEGGCRTFRCRWTPGRTLSQPVARRDCQLGARVSRDGSCDLIEGRRARSKVGRQ